MVTNNSMEDFPEVENKQEWYDYRYDGGSLAFQEWIDAGMPTAQEEQAALVWLERFAAMVTDIIENDPGRADELKLQAQDMKERLSGTDAWEGSRHTVLDLPSDIRNAVNNYWGNLPAAKQKEIDQQAREAQQQAETIAQQRGQLPLNVRGSLNQQVQAGYSAIQSLQNQLATAPEYLQGTIRNQISQLQTAIDRTKEDIKTSLRLSPERPVRPNQGTREEWLNLEEQAEKAKEAYLKPPKVSSGYEYRPEAVREQREAAKERWQQLKEQADAAKHAWMISDEQEALQAAEDEEKDIDLKLSKAMEFKQRLETGGDLSYLKDSQRETWVKLYGESAVDISNLEEERDLGGGAEREGIGGNRSVGKRTTPLTGSYRATYPYPDEPAVMEWVPFKKEQPPAEPYIPSAFKDVALTSGQPTWKSWFEGKYSSVVSELFQKPSEQQTEQGWSGFLEKERLRLREEFMKQSPYQRGERPGVYAPRLRTVAF